MESSVACDDTLLAPRSSSTTLRDSTTFPVDRDEYDPAPPLDPTSTLEASDDLRDVLALIAAFFVGGVDCSASSVAAAAAAAAAALDLGVPVVATTFLPPPPPPLPPTRIVCECVRIAPVGVP